VPSAARVAWGLAALLWGAALAGPRADSADCSHPAELRAEGGHSVEVGCAGGAPLRGPARVLFGLALDPNRADAATLETLPGIGPVRARAVVAARAERPFERLEDLRRVPGIGPVTLAGLAGRVALGAPGPAAEEPVSVYPEDGP
jgi:competence protein ComEA